MSEYIEDTDHDELSGLAAIDTAGHARVSNLVLSGLRGIVWRQLAQVRESLRTSLVWIGSWSW